MREFRISDKETIIARSENTRYGFRHLVEFLDNGSTVETAKACYYNRTWESYDFESAIHGLLSKMVKNKQLTQERQEQILNICSGKAKAELNEKFGMVSAIASMGEIFCDDKKEKNDWKVRMLKAGLGSSGLQIPDDWDSLSENEKELRLNKIIELGKVEK